MENHSALFRLCTSLCFSIGPYRNRPYRTSAYHCDDTAAKEPKRANVIADWRGLMPDKLFPTIHNCDNAVSPYSVFRTLMLKEMNVKDEFRDRIIESQYSSVKNPIRSLFSKDKFLELTHIQAIL